MTSQNDIYKGPCAAEKIEQEGGPPVQEVFPVNLKSLCQIRIFIKKILVFGGSKLTEFRWDVRCRRSRPAYLAYRFGDSRIYHISMGVSPLGQYL